MVIIIFLLSPDFYLCYSYSHQLIIIIKIFCLASKREVIKFLILISFLLRSKFSFFRVMMVRNKITMKNESMKERKNNLNSLCLRVLRDFPAVVSHFFALLEHQKTFFFLIFLLIGFFCSLSPTSSLSFFPPLERDRWKCSLPSRLQIYSQIINLISIRMHTQ